MNLWLLSNQVSRLAPGSTGSRERWPNSLYRGSHNNYTWRFNTSQTKQTFYCLLPREKNRILPHKPSLFLLGNGCSNLQKESSLQVLKQINRFASNQLKLWPETLKELLCRAEIQLTWALLCRTFDRINYIATWTMFCSFNVFDGRSYILVSNKMNNWSLALA